MFTDIEDIKIQSVPALFKQPDHSFYPSDNYPCFEYWLYENLRPYEIKGERIYLPVIWTAYFKDANYGNDKNKIDILQMFLNSLDTNKKYFTIVQYDDNILNDISHLDIKVFSMAGGRKDYGLPLICQPHAIKFNNQRDIFCSFVGRITNPIRQKIVDAYTGKQGYYVSTNNHSLPEYCRILSRSVFGLTPMGYGINAFRTQECLEYGAIPIIVSNELLPIHDLNFEDFGYWVKPENIDKLDSLLRSRSDEEIKIKQANGKFVFDNYFTFEANKKLILENL
jgi:hypothetical protein